MHLAMRIQRDPRHFKSDKLSGTLQSALDDRSVPTAPNKVQNCNMDILLTVNQVHGDGGTGDDIHERASRTRTRKPRAIDGISVSSSRVRLMCCKHEATGRCGQPEKLRSASPNNVVKRIRQCKRPSET